MGGAQMQHCHRLSYIYSRLGLGLGLGLRLVITMYVTHNNICSLSGDSQEQLRKGCRITEHHSKCRVHILDKLYMSLVVNECGGTIPTQMHARAMAQVQ